METTKDYLWFLSIIEIIIYTGVYQIYFHFFTNIYSKSYGAVGWGL